jgi:tRNA dimethylallyltransferase
LNNLIPKVYIIAGPTAVGKTTVAIELAQRMGTSIVSADSRQCYKEMSVGTSKPTKDELQLVRHYFVDAFPVSRILSAADYEALALQYLDEIFVDHSCAVVCGGTGLYIKALCEGLDAMPETDATIASETEATYKEHGLEWLQESIQVEDPEFYKAGEIQNPARMLRALSFIRTTGTSIVQYRTAQKKTRPFDIVKVGLELPREELYSRINKRVDDMMAHGLMAEVENLIPYRDNKNLQTVGYTELFEYLEGRCSFDEAVDKIKQHTRNYAKRQMTWFKKDKEMIWFNADDKDLVNKIAKQ